MQARKIEMGTRLRECRLQVRLLPDEVARELKVSVKTIYAWESGAREPGSLSLADLVLLYGVSSDYILFGTAMVPDELRSLYARVGRTDAPGA